MNDPSVPTVIEVVNETMRAYSFAPAIEPKLTNPTEVQDAIRCLKVGKAPGPDGISKSALKHLPLSVVSLLVVLFNAIFSNTVLPGGLEARTRVFDPGTGEKSGAAPILYRRPGLLNTIREVLENPTVQDSLRGERTRVITRFAV